MTNLKKLGIALVVIVIAIGGYFFPTGKTVVERVTEKLGSTATLDGVDNPFVSIGGFKEYSVGTRLNATSSIPCSIAVTATSSLQAFGIEVVSNGLGAQIFDVSTSSSAYAASTSPSYVRAGVAPAGSFARAWMPGAASTSPLLISRGDTGLSVGDVIYPGQFLQVRIATSSPSTFTGGYWTGTCSAKFLRF